MPLRPSRIFLAACLLLAAILAPVPPGHAQETPATEQVPAAQAPAGRTPGGQTPGGQTPGGQTPGGQTPGGQAPAGQAPAGQTPGAAPPDAAQQIAGWNRVLDGIQQALGREGVTNAQLAEFSDEALRIGREASALITLLTPRVNEISQQIDQLGKPPGEGDPPEAEAVATKRASLQEALAAVDGPLREARLVIVRTDQINGAALSKRRDRFLRQLTERTSSILDPLLWRETAAGLPRTLNGLRLLLRDSPVATARRIQETPGRFLLLLVQIAAGVVVVWYLRRFIRRRLARHAQRLPADGAPGRRAAHHLSEFICNGVLPAILLIFIGRMTSDSGLVSERFDRLIRNGLVALGVLFVAFSLLRVFLRPARPQWRIVNLSDGAASRVFAVVTLGLVVAGVIHMLSVAAVLQLAPFEISLVMSALFALTCLVTTLRALLVVGGEEAMREAAEPGGVLFRWPYLRGLLWLSVVAGALGLLFGYIGLSEFIAYQTIMALIVIAVVWLLMRWIDEAREAILKPAAKSSRAARMQTSSVRQTAVLGFGMLRVVILVIAVMALLLPWGVRTTDWLVVANRAFFGFEVGDLTISFSSILMALFLFVGGALVTRAIQHWVSTQYLPTTSLDMGLRNSITTVLGYVGLVLAAVLAIGTTGIDLSSLAIVVGALSVGIGLGLQGIVNNFVSGLILLAERPIKAGDWVVTGGGEGMVRRISVRSTEIETFDRATVIVPNSTLISESLTNWTHRSKLGRVIVAIGVGYSSDPEQVRAILLKCAEEHPVILAHPEPFVAFMDFGSDALIFELRAWVADILDGFGAKSDLRFAILKALREAQIEIPFPQRDLHIRSGLEGLRAVEAPKPKRAARSSAAKRVSDAEETAKSAPGRGRRKSSRPQGSPEGDD